ncbi:predicted protein [Sclerotinia sclerotiorum 1980 UF-70]|uniref:Uncharacterized protein n=1 Tax=Sclerotinia sclerotiorum (strain ATCC 18683 / 1980 / Ss-1) TaxID=665079 RepID=A7FA51_SCLS1|nr:predicted protein [Sclerotinia sclerotiorum 1980 UF-70]EDO00612.1 predicted protein [Sclerotinia sclerotiorum 1980 UF-70]
MQLAYKAFLRWTSDQMNKDNALDSMQEGRFRDGENDLWMRTRYYAPPPKGYNVAGV